MSSLPYRLPGALRLSAVATLLFVLMACEDGTAPAPVREVHQVIVGPGARNLIPGDTAHFTVRLLDQDGRDLTGVNAQWRSGNPAIVALSSTGIATAVAEGSAFIRATAGGKADSVQVTVSPAPVASVQLNLSQLSLAKGTTQQLSATAKDAQGRVLNGRAIEWRSNGPQVATVSQAGLVTAINIGTTSVTATIEGIEASAQVTVTPPPVAEVTVSPGAAVIEIGEQRQYTAVVKDADGNVLEDREVQWFVNGTAATITQSGLLTGTGHGYITVSATSEGVSFTVGATVVEQEYAFDLMYNRFTPNGESEIFIMTLGGGATPVKLNAGNVSRTPTPSPTGSRIAFAVSMKHFTTGEWIHDLFAVDRNGMNMKQLTTDPGYDDSPDWSPAGNRIVWVNWSPNSGSSPALPAIPLGRSDIWAMNPDGTNKVNLTADMPAGASRRDPAWSKDGTRIAFIQLENTELGSLSTLYVMRADGSEKQAVTSNYGTFDATPTWSPDGRQIALVRYHGPEADITILDRISGETRRLMVPGLESRPAWSPDGLLIAFSLNDKLYTIQPDGSRLRLRSTNPAWGGGVAPTWINRQY